jgi:hypothetical protein
MPYLQDVPQFLHFVNIKHHVPQYHCAFSCEVDADSVCEAVERLLILVQVFVAILPTQPKPHRSRSTCARAPQFEAVRTTTPSPKHADLPTFPRDVHDSRQPE